MPESVDIDLGEDNDDGAGGDRALPCGAPCEVHPPLTLGCAGGKLKRTGGFNKKSKHG